MAKRLPICSLCLSLGSIIAANATSPHVSVVDKQESKSSIPRSEVSRINLGDGNVEIVRKNGETLNFSKEDIARILLYDELAGIEETFVSGIFVSPRITHDLIRIGGTDSNTRFHLFDMNGSLRFAGICNADTTEVSLASLQNGIYLLVVGRETFKIVKN